MLQPGAWEALSSSNPCSALPGAGASESSSGLMLGTRLVECRATKRHGREWLSLPEHLGVVLGGQQRRRGGRCWCWRADSEQMWRRVGRGGGGVCLQLTALLLSLPLFRCLNPRGLGWRDSIFTSHFTFLSVRCFPSPGKQTAAPRPVTSVEGEGLTWGSVGSVVWGEGGGSQRKALLVCEFFKVLSGAGCRESPGPCPDHKGEHRARDPEVR